MAVITVEGNTSTRAPQSRGLTNDRHLQARADGLTAAQDERPQSSLGTRYPTQSTARGPRSSPGPASPGTPAGVALAAPIPHGPRAGQSLGLADELGNRRRRRIACLGEADAASTRTPPFTGCGRNTGGSGDSDTFTKARRYKDVRAGKARDDYPSTRRGAPPGRFRHHRATTAPHGPASGNWEVSHQMSTGTEPDLGQARGARHLSQPPK